MPSPPDRSIFTTNRQDFKAGNGSGRQDLAADADTLFEGPAELK